VLDNKSNKLNYTRVNSFNAVEGVWLTQVSESFSGGVSEKNIVKSCTIKSVCVINVKNTQINANVRK